LARLGRNTEARAAHEEAAGCGDEAVAAYFLAWAARVADEPKRSSLADRVRAARPDFAAQQARAAVELIEREDFATAREVVELGLAVVPAHLELLDLRRRLPEG
jgi:hypothetical protein